MMHILRMLQHRATTRIRVSNCINRASSYTTLPYCSHKQRYRVSPKSGSLALAQERLLIDRLSQITRTISAMTGAKQNVLVVGATRGLGASLVSQYADAGATVYGTARSEPKDTISPKIKWISSVDAGSESAGPTIVKGISDDTHIDIVIVVAGYFRTETFDEPSFEEELKMYKISSIGPVFIVHHLVKAGKLGKGSKIFFLSSESGSITLRHQSEGGGNFAHHASKTALNMVGKLLSLDLKDKGIAVGLIHPGFMKTEMTKDVGFDKFYEDGGAVTPDEAAKSLRSFIETFDISSTGQFWAPRGAAGIGTIEDVLGKSEKELPTPLELPW